MVRTLILGAALIASVPAAAKPGLTVPVGETWIFSVDQGQPARARKAAATERPGRGEIAVTVRSMMGTSMSVTNNSRFDYAYRATLLTAGGKSGEVKSCAVPANGRVAFEHWSQAVAAVRLSDFRAAPAGSLCP